MTRFGMGCPSRLGTPFPGTSRDSLGWGAPLFATVCMLCTWGCNCHCIYPTYELRASLHTKSLPLIPGKHSCGLYFHPVLANLAGTGWDSMSLPDIPAIKTLTFCVRVLICRSAYYQNPYTKSKVIVMPNVGRLRIMNFWGLQDAPSQSCDFLRQFV